MVDPRRLGDGAADGTVTLLDRVVDSVVDANVVGVPDPTWGSAVTAIVELRRDAVVTDAELVDALRGRLSGYELPKSIVRVDTLYRSPNGKPDHQWAVRTAKDALGID